MSNLTPRRNYIQFQRHIFGCALHKRQINILYRLKGACSFSLFHWDANYEGLTAAFVLIMDIIISVFRRNNFEISYHEISLMIKFLTIIKIDNFSA